MTDDPLQPPVPLQREREHAVQVLIDHYAADNLTVEEFESRLDSAYAAATTAQLEDLLSGLPVLASSTAVQQVPRVQRVPAEAVRDHGFQIAIMGGYEKKGEWTPPRKLQSLAIMGGAGLDFREAKMPPGLAVETHGFGFMGGFEGLDQVGVDTDRDAPRLVIRGVAIMGGVEVAVRLPGESAKDARQRRRIDRKKRHRLRSGRSE